MAGQISLQPQKCEECGQQEMRWEISVAEIAQEQNINKDIDSKTFDTIVGKRSSTTEETDTEERKKSEMRQKRSISAQIQRVGAIQRHLLLSCAGSSVTSPQTNIRMKR